MGAEQCSTCKVGSYTSGGTALTRTTCTSCPPGYKCDGTSKQTICEGGYFSGGGDNSCHPCGANHQYSVAGAASCSLCGAGYYTMGGTQTTRTACKPYEGLCAHGKLAEQNLRTRHDHCGACDPGYYLDGHICSPWAGQCADGQLIEQVARTMHNHCGMCDVTHFPTDDHTCRICPTGYACDGSKTQTRCEPGYFADGGESQCHECGGDNKHSQHQAEQCSTCELGSYTSGGTARTRTMCTVCPPGYKCDGTSSQTICEGGFYSPGGDDMCHQCGANNKYS